MNNYEFEDEKVQKKTAVDLVYGKLKALILDGSLKPGDKLPSETELSKKYGVNRLTVRLAIQKLSSVGVVETLVGNGSYIRQFSLLDALYEARDFLFAQDDISEITALRFLIETECSLLAIKNATDVEIERLYMLSDEFFVLGKEFLEAETMDFESPLFEKLLDADVAYHQHIFLMSHNTIYYELFFLIKDAIKISLKDQLHSRIQENANKTFDNHTVVCKAIKKRDTKACREAYSALLNLKNA